MIKRYSAAVLLLCCFIVSPSVSAQAIIEQESAQLCMDIEIRTKITGLEDFELETSDVDGSDGAQYRGGDAFRVESNAPVRIVVNGSALQNRGSTLSTSYSLDGKGDSLETEGGVHNAVHTLTAISSLGDVSEQLAGQYSAQLTLTVVPQITSLPSCDSRSEPIPDVTPAPDLEQEVEISVPQLGQDADVKSQLMQRLGIEGQLDNPELLRRVVQFVNRAEALRLK